MKKYIPINYTKDIDEAIFDYAHYGNIVFRPCVRWSDTTRTDFIVFTVEDIEKLAKT